MTYHRITLVWSAGLIGVILLSASIVTWMYAQSEEPSGPAVHPPVDTRDLDAEARPTVKTIHPKRDANFVISVQELASVEAYFTADLYSRVSGSVKYIHKDIGDRVAKGEVLAEIDVPDVVQEVAEKETIITQRLKDLKLAATSVRLASSAVAQAQSNILQKQEDLSRERSMLDYREKRYQRFAALLVQRAIDANVVDEEERDFRSARASHRSAEAGVKKAQAEMREKLAGLEAAEADVELQKARVEVARKDRDRVQALADYAKIRAPFDGTMTRRSIDPGDFVQSASTAQAEPLLSVARSDIVTVVTKLPDNYAPFVNANTEAVVLMDELPGTEIRGRVTRFAPAIRTADRTLRVEADLFNGPEHEYQHFVAKSVAVSLASLGNTQVLSAMVLHGTSRDHWRRTAKGGSGAFPMFPKIAGGSLGGRRLLPGMSGSMRLQIQKFQNSFLVPSSAVFTRGGKDHIMEIKNDEVQLVPVRVQINDGKLAKVMIVVKTGNPKLGAKEVVRELTGDELIVTSRQLELTPGDRVNPSLEEWHIN